MREDISGPEDSRRLFDYRLEGAGWATVTLRLRPDAEALALRVSYLHDSLRELASAILALDSDSRELAVCFVEEPGVHRLHMRRPDAEQLELEVRYLERIPGLRSTGEPMVVVDRGTLRWRTFRGCVVSVLQRLWREHGAEGYAVLWRTAPFPVAELRALERR
jgi:hypothetical protein